jgi:hypothetical protein
MLESDIENDSIKLDTVPPLVRLSINGGATYTRYRNVTLGLEAVEDFSVESMQLSPDQSFSGAGWGIFLPLLLYDLPVGDGPKTLHARLRDSAGNIGPANRSVIILDAVAPHSAMDTGAEIADADQFGVGWNGTDLTSGVRWYDVSVRDGNGSWVDWLQGVNSTSAIFVGKEGHTYQFRVRAQDNAGNQEEYPTFANRSIFVRPRLPVVTITFPANSSTVHGLIKANGTARHTDPGRTVISVMVSLDGGDWKPADGTAGWSFPVNTTKLKDGHHVLRARAFDGQAYSGVAETGFTVKNPKTNVSMEGLPLCIMAIIVALTSVLLGVYVRYRRRRGLAEK